MDTAEQDRDRERVARLVDEAEQLRTALETAADENTRLAEDRAHLLGRIEAMGRALRAAQDAEARTVTRPEPPDDAAALAAVVAIGNEQEELRVAFEELKVLSEELEIANAHLQEANRFLDRRVAERTSELARNNEALAASERRFRTLVEGIPQLVWRAVDEGCWTWASPQWENYTGRTSEASLGLGWLAALHPEDREAALGAWARATAGAPLAYEARILDAAAHRYRHFQVRASAMRDDDGAVVEWLGTSTDIDELIRLQRRQQTLLADLQHRVRNILTVVRSVFGRTMEGGGDTEERVDHFRGRLDSLGRTQMVVTASASGEVDLENLIRDELLSIGASDGPSLTIEGPDVGLPAKAAEMLGLAIHELATNALKYGALKGRGAALAIAWQVRTLETGVRRLDLGWTESGVPAIDVEPTRQGFGTELIVEALPYALGAQTEFELRGGGVRCAISVPLPTETTGSVPVDAP